MTSVFICIRYPHNRITPRGDSADGGIAVEQAGLEWVLRMAGEPGENGRA